MISKISKEILNYDYVSYYWIGFLLADGHLNKNSNIITVSLSVKDENHLIDLANYFNCSFKIREVETGNMIYFAFTHKEICRELCNKFDINPHKTKFPPNVNVFSILSYNELLALFIGFVDGDGHLRKLHNRNNFAMSIKCHSSWIDVLKMFNEKLQLNAGVKINNQGYTFMTLGDSEILKRIKQDMLLLDIPFLERKWDKINLEFVGSRESKKIKLFEIDKLLKVGMKTREISNKLNIPYNSVRGLIKTLNKKDEN